MLIAFQNGCLEITFVQFLRFSNQHFNENLISLNVDNVNFFGDTSIEHPDMPTRRDTPKMMYDKVPSTWMGG